VPLNARLERNKGEEEEKEETVHQSSRLDQIDQSRVEIYLDRDH
jgi:hypothetical protein